MDEEEKEEVELKEKVEEKEDEVEREEEDPLMIRCSFLEKWKRKRIRWMKERKRMRWVHFLVG